MASVSETLILVLITVSISVSLIFSATVVEDLATLKPPPDFNSTIVTNCQHLPSLRYCNSSPMDLNEIFKFTIVASHLCNESKNPNCVQSFAKIDLRNRPKIVPLYLSYNFFWKYCPLTILSIDLSNNSLKGTFPTDLLSCTQIHALDLSLNALTGDVPVDSFAPLTNLTFLNLSFNSFMEGRVSDSHFFKRFNGSSFLHSGLIPSHHNYKLKAMLLLLGFPFCLIVMILCFGWVCIVRPDHLPKMLHIRKHTFTPAMLKAATDHFSRKNLVVKTEAVSIYRGTLRDGSEVRVDIYRNTNISREDQRIFTEECKVLVQLRHENIVRVVGWCGNRKMRAIVTEWTEGDNVEMWLKESVPSWKQRLRLLMKVVQGMCYLQDQWPEIGYDLRTNSVLVNTNMEPLISRFKIGHQNMYSKNIYKFGVFLLEMITDRRLQEEFERGQAGFIEYITRTGSGNPQNVIDARMKLPENMLDQAKHGIELGLMCTDESNSKLPSLDQIFNMIARAYKSCLVSEMQTHRRTHRDRERTHSHR